MTNKMTETQQPELAIEELRSLYYLVRSLCKAQALGGVVTTFLEKLTDVVPFDLCTVILSNSDGRQFEITHAAGEHAASLVGRKIVSGEGVSGWVVANRHPFFNADPRLDLPPVLADRFDDYRTLAVVPILNGNDLFGAVALYSSTLFKYDATHERLLNEASGFLALALSAVSPPAPGDAPEKTINETIPMVAAPSINHSSRYPTYTPTSGLAN